MGADRALDARVAKEVMGWEPPTDKKPWWGPVGILGGPAALEVAKGREI